MKKSLFAAAMLLTATAAAAQIAPVAPVAPIAPREGVQTRAEVVQRVQAMFARADANRDGFITREEGRALHAQRGGKGQGQAVRANRAADPARRAQAFDRLDANRDNVISRDEWARAQAQRFTKMGARGGQRMAMRGGMMRGAAMLRMADANRDQRISLQEATAAALQRFDQADLNHDGRITADERQQRAERMRQQWQQRAPATRG